MMIGIYAPRAGVGQFAELVVHLAARRVASMHRFTLLGWTWPLVRQLAQLGVLVLVFSAVLDLDIENYAVFVFVGLIAWGWFAAGVGAATESLQSSRHLVLQARFPDVVLPVVAVAVPLVDVLLALPVLLVMLTVAGELHATFVLLPALLAVQLVLMCGLGWLAAAVAVYLHDVGNIVTVGLTLLFYLTPVFYDVARVPERYETILRLNPMTTLVEAYRAVVLDSPWPSAGAMLGVVAASALIAVAGALAFRRLQPGFVDEL